jgi:hypothetical protein
MKLFFFFFFYLLLFVWIDAEEVHVPRYKLGIGTKKGSFLSRARLQKKGAPAPCHAMHTLGKPETLARKTEDARSGKRHIGVIPDPAHRPRSGFSLSGGQEKGDG